MSTLVCVYDSHRAAINAARELKDAGVPVNKVSVIGTADKLEEAIDDVRDTNEETVTKKVGTTVGIGAGMGAAVGVLTGIGIFAIPGLGLLYGAGALVGALAGANFGMIGGGAVSALQIAGMKDEDVQRYESHIRDGKYLLFIQADGDEAKHAREVVDAKCQAADTREFA